MGTYLSGETRKMGGERVKQQTRANGLKSRDEDVNVAGQTIVNKMRWQPDRTVVFIFED